jgi:DNA-binding CsgD family transcriptional regulator
LNIDFLGTSEELLSALTRTFQTIGSDKFNEALMAVLNQLLPIDHCVVFTFSENGEAQHLFTQGKMNDNEAERLASDYVEKFHREDPNVQNLAEIGQAVFVKSADDWKNKYDPTYRRHFFSDTKLVDKAASIEEIDNDYVYCNFYRMSASGTYSDEDRELIARLIPAATALIAAHYRMCKLIDPVTEKGGGTHVPSLVHNIITKAQKPFDQLTQRERQVCERIVLGYTSEGIGLDLRIKPSSVATYRKRAYDKLKITSQNELFSLCLRATAR